MLVQIRRPFGFQSIDDDDDDDDGDDDDDDDDDDDCQFVEVPLQTSLGKPSHGAWWGRHFAESRWPNKKPKKNR